MPNIEGTEDEDLIQEYKAQWHIKVNKLSLENLKKYSSNESENNKKMVSLCIFSNVIFFNFF